jgi:NTE family protein
VAKAMAADVVIAVDLNSGLSSRREVRKQVQKAAENNDEEPQYKYELLKKLSDYYASAETSFRTKINELFRNEEEIPDIIDTVMTSINIMQERITRVNLAVEPPDILIQPRLGELKMMDFDQVDHAIEEGYLGVMERMDDIKALLAKA